MKITQAETFHVAERCQFVRVETDEGLVGWGEAVVPGRAETVAAAVREMLEALTGREANRIEDIWQTLYRGGFFRGGAEAMSAIGGIDQALWDIKGKRYKTPVYELLGGRVRDRIQVYAWLGGKAPDEYAASARERVAQGYTAVKMNGPGAHGTWRFIDSYQRVDEVVKNVAAVRAAVGFDIAIGIDFHGVAHKAMAKILAKELEPLHPLFIEEPVLPENNEALRDIAQHTSIPIATGERMYSRWDFKRILQEGYVDILQPDVTHAGGISEVKKIAAMAEAYDVAIAPHCPLGPVAFMACLQVDSGTPNALIQEQVIELHDVQNSALLEFVSNKEAFHLKDGCVAVPGEPGLGIVIDEAGVRAAQSRGRGWRVPLVRNADGTVGEW